MAHLVETMVSTQREWHHHLTAHTVADAPMTGLEAQTNGGLLWEVEKRPLFMADRDGNPKQVKDGWAVVRVTDDEPLGVVGRSYKVFQNRELFEALDVLAEDTGVFRYQTAGSFFETNVRVVCNNTFSTAIRSADAGRIVRIPHVGDMEVRLDEARKILGLVHRHINTRCAAMRQLQEIMVGQAAAQRFLDALFPVPQLLEGATQLDKVEADMEREKVIATQLKIVELAEGGRGVAEFPSVRGTAYGWLNAVTEFTTHEQRRHDRSIGGQLTSSATGEAGRINSRALAILNSDLMVSA